MSVGRQEMFVHWLHPKVNCLVHFWILGCDAQCDLLQTDIESTLHTKVISTLRMRDMQLDIMLPPSPQAIEFGRLSIGICRRRIDRC